MYLYDKHENKLDLYLLKPLETQLCEYRKQEMKKIPGDATIFTATTASGFGSYKIFELYEDKLDSELLPIENVNGNYHKLEPDFLVNMYETKEMLLSFYYYGYLKDNRIAKIQDLKKIRYFLLNQTKYMSGNGVDVIKGIIEIPESLYLLSLIEQEKFSLIGNKDVSDQLNLFKIEQLKEFDLETLEKMDVMGIFPDNYSNIVKKAENDSHILKLIKK